MALIKAVSDATGATFSYWRITDVRIFPGDMRAMVTLSGYVSADTRLAGMKPGGLSFGFDLAITSAALPSAVAASTGLDLYMAMATVFYDLIKVVINAPPSPTPDPVLTDGQLTPDGTQVYVYTPHPLAGALDG